jgi:hypothetical protein
MDVTCKKREEKPCHMNVVFDNKKIRNLTIWMLFKATKKTSRPTLLA